MNARDRREIARLIVERRWGALATLREDGTPLASQVAYAAQPANGSLLMHLSELAEHTRNLLVRRRWRCSSGSRIWAAAIHRP